MYICIYISKEGRPGPCVHTFTHIRVRVCVCVCVCIHIYIQIHIYIYIANVVDDQSRLGISLVYINLSQHKRLTHGVKG